MMVSEVCTKDNIFLYFILEDIILYHSVAFQYAFR